MRTRTQLVVAALPIAVALFLASCATRPIFGPDEDEKSAIPDSPHVFVDVDSQPIGALVTIDGIRFGTAPLRARIETREDGTPDHPVVFIGDFSTNVRTPGADNKGRLEVGTGDSLPR